MADVMETQSLPEILGKRCGECRWAVTETATDAKAAAKNNSLFRIVA